MTRPSAVLALLFCAACYNGKVSLGTCNQDSECAARVKGSTCDNHVCTYACPTICGAAEQCVNAQCIAIGPAITAVNAPTTWTPPTQSITVAATADGTKTEGVASAALQIAGQADIAGTTTDTGLIKTFTFTVPGTVRTTPSEVPIDFKIVATSPTGKVTPPDAAGLGKLLFDGLGPKVNGVTITNGVPVGPAGQQINWFARTYPQNIDAVVSIQDGGSGVNAATLKLVLLSDGTQINTGGASCAPSTTGSDTKCHLSIPPSTVPLPSGSTQGLVKFAVAGADNVGNAVQGNTAAVGVDGKVPTVTFSVAYPAAGLDCAASDSVASTTCGHDGGHFWRTGDGKYTLKFSASDVYGAPDDVGSGIDTALSSCAIAGVPTCTTTYDPVSGKFTFPAEFGGASFTSGADGSGNVSITVQARDSVGNLSTPVSVSVSVTRLKWVRKVTVGTAVTGAPVMSPALGQVIFAATVPANNDSVYALNIADGKLAWAAGGPKPVGVAAPAIPSVNGNMALDTSSSSDIANHPTPILYVNSGKNVFALHFTPVGVDKYCSTAASSRPAVGSPIIFGGGATAYAISISQDRLVAFQTSLDPSGGSCPGTFFPGSIPASSPLFGSGSALANTIYWTYDNHIVTANDYGLDSLTFINGSFGTSIASKNLGKPAAGGVSPASDLFYGVSGDRFYRLTTDYLTQVWASGSSPSLSVGVSVVAQPLIRGSVVYGAADALYSYDLASGNAPTGWPIAVNSGNQVAPPAITGNAIFVADKNTPAELKSYDLTGKSNWTFTGAGSAAISGVATEATLGSDGVLYFGDAGGNLFALFSDAKPAAVGANDWPRTGYDNCNSNHSNNSGFTCQ